MATQLQGTGLFGMPTVQEARERYRQQSMLSPAQMASQGLLQRLASVISQGGATAGEGIGRLLGGKAPGEAEALGMEQAMREVMASGETDPAKRMLALADALQQRGLSRAAMAALEKGRAMQTEDIQRRAAEGRLKQLTPIYGPTETTIDKETLRPVSTKPIIGYIDGEGTRYSVEQAKSLFPGQVVDKTVPPPKEGAPKTPEDLAKAEMERRAGVAKDKGKEPAKTPMMTRDDFARAYQDATETSEQRKLITDALEKGIFKDRKTLEMFIQFIDANRAKPQPVKRQKPRRLPFMPDQPIGGA